MAKTKDDKLKQANKNIQELIDYLVNYSVDECAYGEYSYCPWSNDNVLGFAVDKKTEPENCRHRNCEDCKLNYYARILREGLLEKYIVHQ